MQKRHRIIRLALLLSLVCLLLPINRVIAQSNSDWQSLRSAAPSDLLERVERDYASDKNLVQPVDVGRMKLLRIRQRRAKELFLINTRLPPARKSITNPSCGQAGCLFYGYIKSGKQYKQVLNGIINDFQVDNALPLIQPIKHVVNQLPCLQLTVHNSQSDRLFSSQLCFDGKDYQPIAPPRMLKQLQP